MSEEHYPAHSVGNDDIVAFDFTKMLDFLVTGELAARINNQTEKGTSVQDAFGKIYDEDLTEMMYPKGRTARTLCKSCNRFLGKYDEAYLKFFQCDGNPKIVKGFQPKTKTRIIKSIFGKFLSVPEAINEAFDFTDCIKDETIEEYRGEWRIYFIKRDYSTDLMGLADIQTGMLSFNEGIVYELSDEKFIFDLMNFPKHDGYKMTDIFDIYNSNYQLVTGVGEYGGYHAQILMNNLFKDKL